MWPARTRRCRSTFQEPSSMGLLTMPAACCRSPLPTRHHRFHRRASGSRPATGSRPPPRSLLFVCRSGRTCPHDTSLSTLWRVRPARNRSAPWTFPASGAMREGVSGDQFERRYPHSGRSEGVWALSRLFHALVSHHNGHGTPQMATATPDSAGKNAVAGIVDCDRGDRRHLEICRSEPSNAGFHSARRHAAVRMAPGT
jgi:hypothetical protein